MKKIILTATLLVASLTTFAQVGIGTETPNASAALDVVSTTKGALLPRMTEAQRNAIANPVEGLMVYCTDCSSKGYYNYTGTAWSLVTGVADGSITAAKIAANAVETTKIKDNAVTTAKIVDGTITASDLATDAVETAKIKNVAVTSAKIASNAVTSAKIADNSITGADILNSTITASDLAANSVAASEIAANAVETAKIKDDAVTSDKLFNIDIGVAVASSGGYRSIKQYPEVSIAVNTINNHLYVAKIGTTSSNSGTSVTIYYRGTDGASGTVTTSGNGSPRQIGAAGSFDTSSRAIKEYTLWIVVHGGTQAVYKAELSTSSFSNTVNYIITKYK